MSDGGSVIPFPPRLRVDLASGTPEPPGPRHTKPLVDYDGLLYPLEELISGLTANELRN